MTALPTTNPSITLPDWLGLAAYHQPGALYYSAPSGALLAWLDPAPVRPGAGATDVAAALFAAVEREPSGELEAGASPAVTTLIGGALPFDPAAPPRLGLLRSLRWVARDPARRERPSSNDPSPANGPRPSGLAVRRRLPLPAGYRAAVDTALRRMAGDGPRPPAASATVPPTAIVPGGAAPAAAALAKVVLARAVELAATGPIDVPAVLLELARRSPHARVYAVPDGEATVVGASPELLVSRRARHVVSHPLAGSAPRSDDPAADRGAAERLLRSGKDRHEHALVVEAVAETLRPYCRSLVVPTRPSLTPTATVWHLGTRIHGVLADPAISSVELAQALHPTPAVCGVPTAAARELIGELEPFDRGLYAGAVGWCDAAGDGEWAVALRCARIEGSSVTAYAGAGIVPGSCAPDELAETTAKLRTVLLALGLDQVL